jgi:hypothetical protein
MSEFKGTKGKWYAPSLLPFKVNCEGKEICRTSITNKKYKADALLISKAPEMLEMLEKSMSMLDNLGEIGMAKQIELLIKSATEL